jgi:hypothetical protein
MASTKSSSKGKRKSKKREITPQDEVVAAFNGCARCSFFLAGYRLLHNDFEQAVDEGEDGWLKLSWDHGVNQHVYKSYGCQLEADTYHFQGSCQFCRRAFIIDIEMAGVAGSDEAEAGVESAIEAEDAVEAVAEASSSALRIAIKNR